MMGVFQKSVINKHIKNLKEEEYFNNYKTEINNLQSEINKTDKEIDQMVYELYSLTEEDIEIVEGGV